MTIGKNNFWLASRISCIRELVLVTVFLEWTWEEIKKGCDWRILQIPLNDCPNFAGNQPVIENKLNVESKIIFTY